MDKLFLEQLPKAASVLYLAFHEFLKSFSCYFLLLFRRMLYNFVFFYGDLDMYILLKKKHVHFICYKKHRKDYGKQTVACYNVTTLS